MLSESALYSVFTLFYIIIHAANLLLPAGVHERKHYIGVRSGMQSTSDSTASGHGSAPAAQQVVRMSLRPPARFSPGSNLELWLRRFEMYVKQTKIPEEQWTGELLPLLDDGPFRVITQQGLMDSTDYKAVTKCLRTQYAPEGNELEWQFKLQSRTQKPGEQLVEFAGALRTLADKAYPKWPAEQIKELLRNQFIHGIRSSSIQLELMKELPATMDEALQKATQQELVEAAQRRLHKEKAHATEALAVDDMSDPTTVPGVLTVRTRESAKRTEDVVEELSKQLQKLTEEVSQLRRRSTPARQDDHPTQKRADVGVCWHCGERGHLRRNCPRRGRSRYRQGRQPASETAAVGSMVMVTGLVAGRQTRMLVDTGSAVTIVREDVWRETMQSDWSQLVPPPHPAVAANGQELDLHGQGEVTIGVGGLAKRHTVLVARGLTQECLLGADYLQKHRCVVDLDKRVLCAGGGVVSFTSQVDNEINAAVCHVAFAHTTVVPAQCQMQLSATVSRAKGTETDELGDAILEPEMSFIERHGLVVAHSLSRSVNSKTLVQVLNPSPAPVTIHRNERIGLLRSLADVCVDVCAAVNHSGNNLEMNQQGAKANKQATDKVIQQLLSGVKDKEQPEKQQLESLLEEFQDVISVGDNDLGHTDMVYHKIDTGDAQPVRQPARRLPFHQKEEVRQLLDDMLSRDIVEPSQGPWSSPIVLVKKKDGSTRFCIDFRKVNDLTRKDAQPLPRIDDTLDAMGEACYFSTLDLASGYWQVALDPSDKEKTAFATPFGLYQFRVMPFGLCNAPATFQRLMEQVLAGLHWSCCLVYLDDIIVFSRSISEHLSKLREVFSRLKQAGLKVKPSKCHLLQKSVHYLGHILSARGVETDPGKIKCIADWPVPTCPRELKQFLGLASYYRRFVKGFAQLASPLYAFTDKREWKWSDGCCNAFMELKKRLMTSPVLTLPRFNLDFILDTDASGEGLGAVLSQVIDGREHVIAYASRVLSKTERKYCTTRREMLALVWATHHFRPYLYGRRFTLRTDHNSLRWLHNFKEPEGQVARWLELLSEFDYRVIHRPGAQHLNADSLSRKPCSQCGMFSETNQDQDQICQVAANSIFPVWTSDEIKEMQCADSNLQQVTQWVESDSFPVAFPKQATPQVQALWNQRKQLILENGTLYRKFKDILGGGLHPKLQLVLPTTFVPEVLTSLHNSPVGGHMGTKKTLEKVRSRFYWPGQRKDVEHWCNSCSLCNSRKSPAKACAPLQPTDNVCMPMQRIAMDILGPLPETERGNRYILVIGDYFTRWKEAFAMKDMEAVSVAKCLVNEVICRFGVPDSLHTDQGKNFESALVKEICQLLGIRKTRTTPYHPQSDGLVERFNRTLLNMLSIAVMDDEHSWDLHLPTILLAYRTSIHETTGVTPFELMFGRQARVPDDVIYSLPTPSSSTPGQYASLLKRRLSDAYNRVRLCSKRQQDRQKDFYDRGVRGEPYTIGDLVMLHEPAVPRGHSRKLHRPWKGPYRVVRVLGPTVYRIQDCTHPRRKKVVHFNRLKPVSGLNVPPCSNPDNSLPSTASPSPMPTLNSRDYDSDEFELAVLPLPVVEEQSPPQTRQPLRRSTRTRRPPNRYGDVVSFPDSLSDSEDQV